MISIIIRALNEAKYFEECLKAIQNQKISEDYEIILVDSGSTDDTIKIGKSYGVAIVNIKKQDLLLADLLMLAVRQVMAIFLFFYLPTVFRRLMNGYQTLLAPSRRNLWIQLWKTDSSFRSKQVF